MGTGWWIPPTPDNLIITAQSLASYSEDSDGDPLTFQVSSGPSSGQAVIAADGTITYFPNAGFSGTDSFQYVVNDGITNSPPVTVSIKVNVTPTGPNVIFAGFVMLPPPAPVVPTVLAPYKPVPSADPTVYYYNDLALAYNMGVINWPFQGSPPSPPGPIVGFPSLVGPITVGANSGTFPQLGRLSGLGAFYSGVALIPFDGGVVVQNYTIGLYLDVYVIRY